MHPQNKIILILSLIILVMPILGYFVLPQFETHRNALFNFDGPASYSQMNVDSTSSYHLFESNTSTSTLVTADEVLSDEESIETNAIFVSTKKPQQTIDLDAVTLLDGGFVVIFENSFDPTGDFLAVSNYLDAGAYTRVPITLFRSVLHGEQFDVVLMKDDGDQIFNIEKDIPFRDRGGNPIYSSFQFINAES